jgi:hypothetical protein
MNAGAKVRPKTETSNAIQQRIDTLNEHFTNNEIYLTKLLDGLSLVVARVCNGRCTKQKQNVQNICYF